MIFKHEFKIDQFVIKHAKDPVRRLESFKAYEAQRFGMAVIEKFPFLRIEEKSFNGELPAMSLNNPHEYMDHYERELVIMDREQFTKALRLIGEASKYANYNQVQSKLLEAIKILTDEYIPLDSDSTRPAVSGGLAG